MTNEQAIEALSAQLDNNSTKVDNENDDLISRRHLLKQIDIDASGEPGYYGDTWKFIDTIKNMPSAQPEIIRCENCANRDDDEWEGVKKVYWCDIMDGCVKADDYCSYAERRVGDSDD